jgi:hypothetical protein
MVLTNNLSRLVFGWSAGLLLYVLLLQLLSDREIKELLRGKISQPVQL